MSVKYANDHVNFEVVRTHHTPVNYSRTGYGRKLPTQYMVFDRGTKRYHRVYVICYSNTGSAYILKGGEMLFLRDMDIPENPRYIGVPDKRYTITLEWCGESVQRHILRFCGDWISDYATVEEAEAAAATYHHDRGL